ncbi:PTS system trehalose-specific EIIBC component [uncultured Cetobacterium sp.]|uniref:PTS system trehalose-specific EIIBC component n=1 Tax=uncultured Cetobacterium sp. TaxID=527638 RepID=UPI0025E2136E|nr:PTS system trehalose-specific EIIBC component [uncultured Cetobacterium sp.]
MGKYERESKEILELIGGKNNIISATHCITRLRLILKDETLVEKTKLENLSLVKGSFSTSGQFQIIIGNAVKDLYKDFLAVAEISEATKDEVKIAANQKMGRLQKVVGGFAEIFTPLLPVIITGGLILGFRNIIGDLAIFGDGTQTLTSLNPKLAELHSFLWILGEAIFHFLPVGVTWSTVKKYGGTEILGIVLGITLVSPQLMNAYGYATAAAINAVPFWDFGFLTIEKVGYQAQVIPAMLAGIFMTKMEISLKKYFSEILKMILLPFLVLLTTLILSYLVIGPISRELGNYIAAIFNVLLTGPFRVFGAILFGMFYAPLVITGVHHTFLAVDLQLIAQGGTMIWPMIALSNIAQGSAAVTIMFLNRKDEKLKSLSLSSAISAWLGVTEPALFGVNLRFMYPFYGALIGSALAAVYSTLTGVLANSIGIGGLPAFLAIQPKFWINYIIAMLIAFIVPIIATYILNKSNLIKNKK